MASMIHKLRHQTGKDWDLILPTAAFIMNMRVDPVTHFSPFELMFYRLPSPLHSYLDSEPKTALLGWHAQLHQAYKLLRPLVEERHTKAKAAQRERIDASHRITKLWDEGQLVMIRNQRAHKGDTHWDGP